VVEGDFIPTAKNAAAADFYARHGFQRISEPDSAASRWRLAVAETLVQWPPYIQLHVPATA
jgi:predicted enzyme involved in methoxymalonyl-ACP biosynthesis